jgi:hypothetical protein
VRAVRAGEPQARDPTGRERLEPLRDEAGQQASDALAPWIGLSAETTRPPPSESSTAEAVHRSEPLKQDQMRERETLIALHQLKRRGCASSTSGSGSCGIGSWVGQRPSLADYVRGTGTPRGATAAGGG